MTTAMTAPRWTRTERILLILLLLAWIPGAPGVGIETRTGADVPWLGYVYTVGFLSPVLALAASWKWPAAAAWLGVLAGVSSIALPVLDSAGVFIGPPPPGMLVVNGIIAVMGAIVLWRSWRLMRQA